MASDRYLQALGSLSTSTTSLTWITVKPSSYQGQEEEDCDDREDEDFGDLDLDAEPLAADDVCLEDYLADRHDEEMEGDQDTGEALEEDAQMLPPVDEEGAREEGRQYLEVEPSTTNEAPEDDSERAMGEDIPSELVEQVEGDETQGGEPWQYELNPRAVVSSRLPVTIACSLTAYDYRKHHIWRRTCSKTLRYLTLRLMLPTPAAACGPLPRANGLRSLAPTSITVSPERQHGSTTAVLMG